MQNIVANIIWIQAGLCGSTFCQLGPGQGIFSNLVPQMRSGPGILHLESSCRDWDPERILISPTNETGTGAYLLPRLSKVP